MLNRNQVEYASAGTGPLHWGPGDKLTFLVRRAQPGGTGLIREQMAPSGGPLPPHTHHREEESLCRLQGIRMIQAVEQTFQASPRDFAHSLEGTVQSFRNKGGMHQEILL